MVQRGDTKRCNTIVSFTVLWWQAWCHRRMWCLTVVVESMTVSVKRSSRQKGVSATVKQSGGNWDLHLPSAHHPLPSAHLYRPGSWAKVTRKTWMEKFVNLRMLQRVWQKFSFLVSGNKRMMNRQYADTAGLSLTHTYGTFMRIFWRSKFNRCLINIDCTVYGTGTFWYLDIPIVTTERGC